MNASLQIVTPKNFLRVPKKKALRGGVESGFMLKNE